MNIVIKVVTFIERRLVGYGGNSGVRPFLQKILHTQEVLPGHSQNERSLVFLGSSVNHLRDSWKRRYRIRREHAAREAFTLIASRPDVLIWG